MEPKEKMIDWLGLSVPELAAEISKRRGIRERGARDMAAQIAQLAPELRKAFVAFWETGEVSHTTAYHGYTLRRLMSQGCAPLAAFLTLDWIIKEPAAALARLEHGVHTLRPGALARGQTP